jgi:hypothetical protein
MQRASGRFARRFVNKTLILFLRVLLKWGFGWNNAEPAGIYASSVFDGQKTYLIVSPFQSFHSVMKNAILNLAAFLMLASAFVACKKEITFKDQLVGHWQSVQVTVGGTDATTSYAFDLHLENSLEFDLDVTTIVPFTGTVKQSYSGDWEEDEAKKDVTLRYSNGDEKTWDIISVSETLLTAELIENNVRYTVKFERQ